MTAPEKLWPRCSSCQLDATCIGNYEGDVGGARFACDHCCGHGNEDGHCEPVDRWRSRATDDLLRRCLAQLELSDANENAWKKERQQWAENHRPLIADIRAALGEVQS